MFEFAVFVFLLITSPLWIGAGIVLAVLVAFGVAMLNLIDGVQALGPIALTQEQANVVTACAIVAAFYVIKFVVAFWRECAEMDRRERARAQRIAMQNFMREVEREYRDMTWDWAKRKLRGVQ